MIMKETKAKVSVLMPNYNSGPFIKEAIESVLAQTYENFELLVFDDASEDESFAVAEKMALQDKRIKLFKHRKNQGIAKTRNDLIRKLSSSSQYIAWLDADDLADPQRLSMQLEFLESHPEIALCGSSIRLINQHGDTIGAVEYPPEPEQIKNKFMEFNQLAQSSVMIRKEVVLQVGFYDESLRRAEDYDYFARVLQKYNAYNFKEPLISYRLHEGQGKFTRSFESIKSSLIVRKRYLFMKDFFSFKALGIFAGYLVLLLLPRFVVYNLYKYAFSR